jgi:hypothetical protein
MKIKTQWGTAAALLGVALISAHAQPDFEGPPPGGPGGFGGRGFGGPGGPNQQQTKVLQKFDKDGNGRLDAAERKAAREWLKKEGSTGRGRGFGRRGPGFGGGNDEPAKPGQKLTPADVKNYPNAPLYDAMTLRTFFLEFEEPDWEKELSEFHNTDVEVPAKLTVDGKTYSDVGVHFRGMSSYMMVNEGKKRSLNLSLDFAHKEQSIGGYRTMNLLNSHEDPTFLRSVLSYQIDREYLPAPKANFARLVINGESWGLYVNVEQFNKDFVKENWGTTKGARWKVRGSPGGRGSLAYLGEDPAAYKETYTIKSKGDPKRWGDLIKLCKVLNETPPDKLEAALAPLLDIDGALKFLALDNALINNDGYWIRTSDYSIYQDERGRFHLVPQDSNETFSKPEGGGGGPGGGRSRGFRGPRPDGPPPGGGPASNGPGPGGFRGGGGPSFDEGWFPRGGPGGPPIGGSGGRAQIKGVELDPLISANDPTKSLAAKLLAVPALRARYLGYVRDIAEKWLDWQKLSPTVDQYVALISDDVKADTRKLDPTDDFFKGITSDVEGRGFGPGGGGTIGLKNFADQRRKYLLEYPEIKKLAK